MRTRTIVLCVVTLMMSVSYAVAGGNRSDRLTVISFNVRVSDYPKADGRHCWENRRDAAVRMIEDQHPTLMGIQEGCPDQVAWLDANMPQYGRIGVGREDGKARGEMMAIYYDTTQLELGRNGTFWLSETPDEVSRGWDGACKRTCTWAFFSVKSTGKQFCYFNTHLDHRGKEARKQAIELIVAKIAELVPADMPLFLTADFNSDTSDPIFDPLRAVMKDARVECRRTDNGPTFNEFGKDTEQTVVIDHIFYRAARAKSFTVLRNGYGVPYVSDHYPVRLVVKLQ